MGGLEPLIWLDGVRTLSLLTKPATEKWVAEKF